MEGRDAAVEDGSMDAQQRRCRGGAPCTRVYIYIPYFMPTCNIYTRCRRARAEDPPPVLFNRSKPCALPQGKMKEILDKQVSGYRNWQATVTEQVGHQGGPGARAGAKGAGLAAGQSCIDTATPLLPRGCRLCRGPLATAAPLPWRGVTARRASDTECTLVSASLPRLVRSRMCSTLQSRKRSWCTSRRTATTSSKR